MMPRTVLVMGQCLAGNRSVDDSEFSSPPPRAAWGGGSPRSGETKGHAPKIRGSRPPTASAFAEATADCVLTRNPPKLQRRRVAVPLPELRSGEERSVLVAPDAAVGDVAEPGEQQQEHDHAEAELLALFHMRIAGPGE